jgi:hypothetical protein
VQSKPPVLCFAFHILWTLLAEFNQKLNTACANPKITMTTQKRSCLILTKASLG